LKSLITLSFLYLFTLVSTPLLAQSWQFSSPIPVTGTAKQGVFHHLESAGRRNVAVSGHTVAVVWEDDRDGTPRIYLSRKLPDAAGFDHDTLISGKGEAYEPGLISLGDGYFAVAWEEDGHVYARIAGPDHPGPIHQVSDILSAQVSMVLMHDRLLLVLREQPQRFGRIVLYELKVNDRLKLSPVNNCAVDPVPPDDDQLYPVISVLDERIVVAWEDRRPGHTIIMANQSQPGNVCTFEPPVRISEKPPQDRTVIYGTGHGVARVALANYGQLGMYAIWADKRNFQEGYDIYGAQKQGSQAFGANVRVQDDFGGNYRQWHATLTGHPDGRLVAAWTDERDGNMDIWYSWLEDGEWGEDLPLPGASGPGVQYHPTIMMDESGNLHLAWIERETVGGPSRIFYLFGAPE
jgi:hypothetical protein